jgi:hypothetical protein
MALGLNVTVRNARLNVIRNALDAGATGGLLLIYDGTRPATGAAVTTQVLLGTLTFSATSAPDASGGVLTFSAITEDSSADATGTATWARATDSDSTFVMDMSVGMSGSGADIIMNTTSIVAGGPIRVDSGTLTDGDA